MNVGPRSLFSYKCIMHKVDLITDNLNYLCIPGKDVTVQRTENRTEGEKRRKERIFMLIERRLWKIAEMLGLKHRI